MIILFSHTLIPPLSQISTNFKHTYKFHNFKSIIAPKKLSFSNSSRSK